MIVYFDKNCAYWRNDDEYNQMFLDCQTDWIIETIKHRGYIYLNQIYEILGARWNPCDDNVCIQDPNVTFVIGLEDKNNRWRIDII